MPPVNLDVDESLEDDQKLWRYMTLSKLIFMAEKNVMWLARVC